MNTLNYRQHALACGAAASLLSLLGCTPSMAGTARAKFAKEHGCDAIVAHERPDLLPAHATGPTFAKSGSQAYEVMGCNHHDLELCDTPGYEGSTLVPGSCSSLRMCDGPGCTTDYATAAQDAFIKAHSCPGDRVTAAPTTAVATAPPTPPPDVAADPARAAIWNRTHQDEINRVEAQNSGLNFIRVAGCGSQVVYACSKAEPAAPRCDVATAAR
jgi:hypothetical protein